MSNKFYIVSGLPGSGKSTLANARRTGTRHIYVNRDTIRGLFGYESPADELADEISVSEIATDLIRFASRRGRDVWFDNINPSIGQIKKQFKFYGFEFHSILCLTPVETCIARQEMRDRKVPAEVIAGFAAKYQQFDIVNTQNRLIGIRRLPNVSERIP